MHHDYEHNGTTTLIAALNLVDEPMIGRVAAASPPGTRLNSQSDRNAGDKATAKSCLITNELHRMEKGRKVVAGTQRFYRGASLGTQDGVVGNGLMRSALTPTSPHQCFEEKSGPWCRLFSIRNILL